MPCKIICELSCNHAGSLERALALVDAAAEAGADGIKLQTWAPGKMVLDDSIVLRNGPWVGTNLSELYARAHTPWEWHQPIFEHAHARGLEAFSSVFDLESLAFLESLHCQRYKIASFELVDLELIRAVAATRRPIILSTGMATKEEIDYAVESARGGGARDITLLKCTSAYPADGSTANLATMRTMAARWSCAVGLSDHTPGVGVAIAAAALGAVMIEKHFTLWRAEGGLDAAFSVEAPELRILVAEARRAEKALGQADQYGCGELEQPQLELRRSLYFAQDLPAGTVLNAAHFTTARPAKGLAPRFARRLLGAKLLVGVRRGTAVNWDLVERRDLMAIGG